jgi:hypothetical protein
MKHKRGTTQKPGVPIDRKTRLQSVREFAEAIPLTKQNKKNMLKLGKEFSVTPGEIANYWWALATADARELTPKVNCRHCWGVDHLFQRTPYEYRKEVAKYREAEGRWPDAERAPFDGEGGDGFDRTRAPNPECPECGGAGIFDIGALDFNKMSPAAALLYDGVVIHRNGDVEVKLRNRSQALQILQRLMGYEVERKMVLVRTYDPSQLSDDELVREADRIRSELNSDEASSSSTKFPSVYDEGDDEKGG